MLWCKLFFCTATFIPASAYGHETDEYRPFHCVMNILLLGDGHTYGSGLSVRQLSYTGHFVRQLGRTGRSVTIEVYAHPTLRESMDILSRLPLNQYDLIVLQLGPDLIERNLFRQSPVLPVATSLSTLDQPVRRGTDISTRPGLLKRIGTVGKRLFTIAASLVSAVSCPAGLARLLKLLRPYRHAVVLMTPFPSRVPMMQWAGGRSRSVLLDEGTQQGYSVLDINTVVQPRDEFFLTGDTEHLNAVSHELIGQALFDFYQSAPTIVTVQTINRKLID